jgi:transposase, IS5 family
LQKKAFAHPTDNKLLETARVKVVEAAKANGIKLKQTYAKEGQLPRYKAGRYAYARQFKRMSKVIKHHRTIVGRLQREVARKMSVFSQAIQETLGKAKRLVAKQWTTAPSSTAGMRQRWSASARAKAAPPSSSV